MAADEINAYRNKLVLLASFQVAVALFVLLTAAMTVAWKIKTQSMRRQNNTDFAANQDKTWCSHRCRNIGRRLSTMR